MAKELNKAWNKEIQRDILALGSPVFYFLVIGRALVGPFWDLFNPLIILAPVIYLLSKHKTDINLYVTRGFLIGTATTTHYGDITFGIFAAVVLALMVAAALNLGRSKRSVTNGVIAGTFISVIGLLIALLSS